MPNKDRKCNWCCAQAMRCMRVAGWRLKMTGHSRRARRAIFLPKGPSSLDPAEKANSRYQSKEQVVVASGAVFGCTAAAYRSRLRISHG
jgi:hypothetical protein